MNPFGAVDISKFNLSEGEKIRLNSGLQVTLKYATLENVREIAQLVQSVRLANDKKPEGYIQAAIDQRNVRGENYFEEYTRKKLDTAKTIIAIVNNEIVGVVTFEALPVGTADVVTAINGKDKTGNPPSFDIREVASAVNTKGWGATTIGELHKIYIDEKHQKKGLGDLLFRCAANSLTDMGFEKVLINTVAGNKGIEKFLTDRGAILGARITEHNTRNGFVFDVLCNLWVVNTKAPTPVPA